MLSRVRLFIQKLYLAMDKAFNKISCIAPQIYLQGGFKFGELHVAIVSSESFANSSRAGIIE